MPLPKVEGLSVMGPGPSPRKDVPPLAAEMGAPKGMRQQAMLPMRKWETPGQKVLAYFLGTRQSSKYEGRSLVDFVDDDGTVETYPCPVILEQLLRGVPSMTVVLVHYRGEEKTAKGETKHFEVFLGEQGATRG